MTDNMYDDADFFESYAQLPRQRHGLDAAPEWPTLRCMIQQTLSGANVMDLGCGYGWFSRWAVEQGASAVHASDSSERMLDRARELTNSPETTYAVVDLNVQELAPDSYDLVFSSLALHYVRDLPRLLQTIAQGLRAHGRLVFSVEHPIYSAPSDQQFVDLADGRRVWPLNDYLHESERQAQWLGSDVRKQHRTVATYINAVIDAGLSLEQVAEHGTTENPDDVNRPWFLLACASKPAA